MQQEQEKGQDKYEGRNRCPRPPMPVRDHEAFAESIAFRRTLCLKRTNEAMEGLLKLGQ
jgi:hypothetical protein